MKIGASWTLLILSVILLAAGWSVLGQEQERKSPPPLSLEGYLDEELPEASADQEEILVDNGACYVCHNNYDGEDLVMTHAKQSIGCIDCHGESIDHRNDEDNITPPDRMYAAQAVDGKCSECHPSHDVSARDVISRLQARKVLKSPEEIVCTDCHFQHRLSFRIVAWDKSPK